VAWVCTPRSSTRGRPVTTTRREATIHGSLCSLAELYSRTLTIACISGLLPCCSPYRPGRARQRLGRLYSTYPRDIPGVPRQLSKPCISHIVISVHLELVDQTTPDAEDANIANCIIVSNLLHLRKHQLSTASAQHLHNLRRITVDCVILTALWEESRLGRYMPSNHLWHTESQSHLVPHTRIGIRVAGQCRSFSLRCTIWSCIASWSDHDDSCVAGHAHSLFELTKGS
jgi:hypothetical protein